MTSSNERNERDLIWQRERSISRFCVAWHETRAVGFSSPLVLVPRYTGGLLIQYFLVSGYLLLPLDNAALFIDEWAERLRAASDGELFAAQFYAALSQHVEPFRLSR